jgi:hypothetical protein
MKRVVLGTLIAFAVLEGIVLRNVSLAPEHVGAVFREPLVLAMLMDFTFFAAIVFLLMVADARKRGASAWPWLPLVVLAPTVALLVYLLLRPAELSVKAKA